MDGWMEEGNETNTQGKTGMSRRTVRVLMNSAWHGIDRSDVGHLSSGMEGL